MNYDFTTLEFANLIPLKSTLTMHDWSNESQNREEPPNIHSCITLPPTKGNLNYDFSTLESTDLTTLKSNLTTHD